LAAPIAAPARTPAITPLVTFVLFLYIVYPSKSSFAIINNLDPNCIIPFRIFLITGKFNKNKVKKC
ncbi:hypothetical protein, partial [Escherichia coli]|uniref:hypothetical protein n=1 Tax=Escherichia coli TaxID=562 RepID=UPI001CBB0E51